MWIIIILSSLLQGLCKILVDLRHLTKEEFTPWFLPCRFFFSLQLLKSNLRCVRVALSLGAASVRVAAGASQVWTTLVEVLLLQHGFHFPLQFSQGPDQQGWS